MGTGKLHMKETPTERQERQLRKARKAAKEAARRAERYQDGSFDSEDDSTRKRRRADNSHSHRPPPPDPCDSDAEYGPPPPGPSTDYETLQAELEEQRWREKMWDAMDEDSVFTPGNTSRLDSLEAEMNTYAHVPKRWRGPHAGGDVSDIAGLDPSMMEDEEYAEWIRVGMWRYKNPDYYAEQARQQAQQEARKAREKAIREETKRLRREAEEEDKRKRAMRDAKKTAEARERYESGWKTLLASGAKDAEPLGFSDIPWPIALSKKSAISASIDDITLDSISLFLFSMLESWPSTTDNAENATDKETKTRKEIVRETLLRFHPDKFEGRVLRRVKEEDKEKVREAVGKVARALNELMTKVDT
ncbi:hypothetical protein NEOLEDRAFT_745031 [Neolentinus lepideus HHB14362 ss-1]|uniref:Uncharacterized protein n=1 Tax=Neolentinus lepideus HHB14362 ss-1 TaxID=1314782 RepID=A0A165PT02_9AGAM|nr:hypothetical protein NEOLEDRAFT_745031 [Neolentinus lepideus HHB14362 ss-1]